MKFELRLFASLKELLPTKHHKETTLSFKEGKIIDDLVNEYNIPRDITLIILVNGRKKDESYQIQDGDRIGIFPPVGGG